MLKLERDTNTRQVCIRTTRGDTLFTRLFTSALIVAIVLHAAFFLIFRIDKGREDYLHLVLPPVSVHTVTQNAEPQEQYSLTEYEANTLDQQSIYEPKPSPVTIPKFSLRSETEFVNAEVDATEPKLFSNLETEFLISEVYPVAISVAVPKVTVKVSGPMNELPYQNIDHPLLNGTVFLPLNEFEQTRYAFDVIIDHTTGKVIWYDKYQDAPSEIEELLLALNFEKNSDRLITKGMVEVFTISGDTLHD